MRLAPCPRCHRHVAVGETRCPFCRAPWTTALVLAVAVAGCKHDDDGTITPEKNAPTVSTTTATVTTTTTSSPPPSSTSSTEDASPPADAAPPKPTTTIHAPAYGLAPRPTPIPTVHPMYGVPP